MGNASNSTTLFIINPKSGKGRNLDELVACIKENFNGAQVVFTQSRGHAKQLAAAAVEEGKERVIVAGGDGTINEAVQSLAGTKCALGIIARGSGNGLAREIGCPLNNVRLACRNISNSKPVLCDVGVVQGEYFVNLAGVGIEADIAHKFDVQGKTGKRGMWPYFKIGFGEVLHHTPRYIEMKLDDGRFLSCAPLTLVFANGRQYGSNFKIAPQASLNDGYLDMVMVEAANPFRLLLSLPNFFVKGLSPVNVTKNFKIKSAEIHCPGTFYYHIDGEPKEAKDVLTISVKPACLNILME
jgi:Sphingosine kinase and enzymes related to eukaryotic diacylglycerol kinase